MARLYILAALLLLGGCADASPTEPEQSDASLSDSNAEVVPDAGPVVDAGSALACSDGFDSGLGDPMVSFEATEDGRYCEVLVVRMQDDGTPLADVYNSLPFGSCPQELWEALDADVIKQDFPDALLVMLNGPRYFLMQDLFDTPMGADNPQVHEFGGITMVKMATVAPDMDMLASQSGYTPVTVNRDNTWRFRAGVRVHELVDAEGNVYVMQSFSQIVDSELTYEDLESLGGRLNLPEGWSYRVRMLESSLDVQADGTATVVQDELQNTYQWRSDCQISPQ